LTTGRLGRSPEDEGNNSVAGRAWLARPGFAFSLPSSTPRARGELGREWREEGPARWVGRPGGC